MARKTYRKGRAMEGMIMEIKKEIWKRGSRIEVEREGIIVGKVRVEGEKWRVVGIYAREGIEKMLEGIEE